MDEAEKDKDVTSPGETKVTEPQAGPKPGIKSTEFYITAALTIVGAIMALLPANGGADGEPTTLEIIRQICGAILAAGAAGGYTISRGLAKGKAAKLLFVAVILGMVIGCSPKGYIKADAVDDLIQKVCDRHDKLLNGEMDPKDLDGDGDVDDDDKADKATYLRSTKLLRGVVQTAQDN
jgi:hypothetical protein